MDAIVRFSRLEPSAVRHGHDPELTALRATPHDSSELVLVIEDDEPIRRLLHRILSAAGYRCLAVGDGNAARRAFREHSPALAVYDLQLPGESGLDVLAWAGAHFPDTAGVIVTGLDQPRVSGRALELGAFGL